MTNNNIIQPPSGAGSAVYITGGTIGVFTNGSGGLISNLQPDQNAILVSSSRVNTSITTLNNYGTINAAGVSGKGITLESSTRGVIASIGTLNNYGTISGGAVSIFNGTVADPNSSSLITTLNNAQGAGNAAGALTYTGYLPRSYGIILGSNSTTYGKLSAGGVANWDGGSGTTNFGIYSGLVKSTKYTAVISGVTASLLTSSSLTGTYSSGGKSYAYSLTLESGSSDTWDLLFPTYYSGPSVANTNQSLVNTASALQGTYTLQNSVLANSFSYDCTVFGANDVCVSAGGRNTAVQAANGLNNTSALLIAAYRPHPNYRIGAYADQNLSVSNPGGTVNLGNNTPLIGLFGAWNERLDGTGTEVKVSAAYGQKNTTITRSVVGSGTGASEAGTGSSTLNSQGVQATAKYGFGIMDNVIVSPYVGVRYTQNNMGGYTESTSSSVTAPLTYSALNTNATTALAGVGASYRVIPTVMTFASAGIETDTNTANGTYTATNSSIGTLTPVNFNANPVKTRPTATVGAYYDIEKNQRLGITGIYRQEAYQAVSTTTVMATYTIGL
ncbi:autotransporter outer membrane beta-barrel domain-containing protein [Polynucleobacter paneuropaeus]|nr:autotransporter outer membrane beta-barrel domain-containing protein [Polynucleobacter paneuropaeus]